MSPGVVETEFGERMNAQDPDAKEKSRQFYSANKAIQAQDVADSVIHIISAPKHVQVLTVLFFVLRTLEKPLGYNLPNKNDV